MRSNRVSSFKKLGSKGKGETILCLGDRARMSVSRKDKLARFNSSFQGGLHVVVDGMVVNWKIVGFNDAVAEEDGSVALGSNGKHAFSEHLLIRRVFHFVC